MMTVLRWLLGRPERLLIPVVLVLLGLHAVNTRRIAALNQEADSLALVTTNLVAAADTTRLVNDSLVTRLAVQAQVITDLEATVIDRATARATVTARVDTVTVLAEPVTNTLVGDVRAGTFIVHEEPFIPNFGTPGSGTKLEEGMVLAIEPIIIAGNGNIDLADDGYTYITHDRSRATQFEHTVIITGTAVDVLTKLPKGD